MRTRKKATILAILAVLVLSLTVSVQPVLACKYGCTPGFWKQPQHFGYWTDYNPDDLVVGVFTEAPRDLNGDREDDTLLDALGYKGGPGPEGAARILLRAAVAWLLNAAYADEALVDWEYGQFSPDSVVGWVNDNLQQDRARMIEKAKVLDDYNNAEGGCPLEGQLWLSE